MATLASLSRINSPSGRGRQAVGMLLQESPFLRFMESQSGWELQATSATWQPDDLSNKTISPRAIGAGAQSAAQNVAPSSVVASALYAYNANFDIDQSYIADQSLKLATMDAFLLKELRRRIRALATTMEAEIMKGSGADGAMKGLKTILNGTDSLPGYASVTRVVNAQNEDLAYFIYLIGVSVDMQYGVSSSGAYVFSDTNNSYYCAQSSLNKIWKYDKSIKGIFREGKADSEWINLIKKEILAGRPVIYAGYGKDGGHAWVCDGFDENNLFSMNWGWGGLYNGFYNINSLNPGSSGIGSGSGSFNSGQGILINIKPSMDNSSIITITGNLDFGKVNIGQSKEQIFYINNIGSKSFFVNTITSDSQYFICDSIVNTTVNPGAQIQIKLKFQPQNIFYQTGHININADANFGVSKIKVTGKGSNPNSIDESYDNNISAILFPNPTSEYLSINTQNINKNSYLEIFDIYGNCFMKQIIQPNETLQKISLNELKSGVYFVKIGNNKLIKFKKI